MLFYKWNTDINGSFRCLDFSSRNYFLEGYIFQWREGSFLGGEAPHGGSICFDGEWGVFKKIHEMEQALK